MDVFIKNKSTRATRAFSVQICVAVRMIGSVHAVLFDSAYCSEIRHQHGLQNVLTQRAPGAQRQFPHWGSRAAYPTVSFSPTLSLRSQTIPQPLMRNRKESRPET